MEESERFRREKTREQFSISIRVKGKALLPHLTTDGRTIHSPRFTVPC